jgi:serine/threonine protein kinase
MKDIIGTLNYLAPEIVSKREYDNKVDIWAFGCILFAMATGDVPFKC